eukprot:evm.model.NODE_12250_length_1293_cov_32.896366.1
MTIIRSLQSKLLTLASQLEKQQLLQEEKQEQQEVRSMTDWWWCQEPPFSSFPSSLPSSPSSLLPCDDVTLEESLDRFLMDMSDGFNGENML